MEACCYCFRTISKYTSLYFVRILSILSLSNGYCENYMMILAVSKYYVISFCCTTDIAVFYYSNYSPATSLQCVDHVSELGVMLDDILTFCIHFGQKWLAKWFNNLVSFLRFSWSFMLQNLILLSSTSTIRNTYQAVWTARFEVVQSKFVWYAN